MMAQAPDAASTRKAMRKQKEASHYEHAEVRVLEDGGQRATDAAAKER